MEDSDYSDGVPPLIYSTKKCPECLTQIKLEETRCPNCNARVSEMDEKTGMAKRPFNWSAYGVSLLAWIALAVFIWVVFLKDKS
jgi:hypothetical protein